MKFQVFYSESKGEDRNGLMRDMGEIYALGRSIASDLGVVMGMHSAYDRVTLRAGCSSSIEVAAMRVT